MKLNRREMLKYFAAATGLSIIRPFDVLTGKSSAQNPPETTTLNIFSKHLQWLGYKEMAHTAAGLGFDGVDLTVRPEGHVEPERANEDLPKALEAIQNAGLQVKLMTTAITDPDESATDQILRIASRYGVTHYRMGYLSYDESLGVAGTLEHYKPRFRELAAINEHYNLHGAYQNHSGTRVGGPVWDLWILLQDLDPRYIGCQYDIRHATVEGGNSWPLSYQILQPYIQTIIIKDFKWVREEDKRWRAQNCPPGEGVVDFDSYFLLLKEHQYSGPISFHYEYPLGGAGRGKRQLRISREKLMSAMRRDLGRVTDWLSASNLY